MAARKLAQEVDKCFKQIQLGVAAFESVHDKISQTTNASQKEKLEESLKREIKKLQRLRDQIKTWCAGNEIKDKGPLVEQRKLIESQMEKFKAVEKEMKTKAYSKEGLSQSAKLDPKAQEKADASEYLQSMVEELERQVENKEAEAEAMHASMKKGKKDNTKSMRIAELERVMERHKWHQGKLELILRALENDNVEVEQVNALKDSLEYYVNNNQEVDFQEDDTFYDDLDLDEEEGLYGMANEVDRVSSQDTQSVQDEVPELDTRTAPTAAKSKPSVPDTAVAGARRPSAQLKSPLPALATLHTPLPSTSNGVPPINMKPAPIPQRIPGEPLKYASAAAAAAASDKNGVGIAPLPPPPGAAPVSGPNAGLITQTAASIPSAQPSAKPSAATSPSPAPSQLVAPQQKPVASVSGSIDDGSTAPISSKSPAPSHSSAAAPSTQASSAPPTPALETAQPQKAPQASDAPPTPALTNGESHVDAEEDESVYHLPSSLSDLLESFEATKAELTSGTKPSPEHLLLTSQASCPTAEDAERPRPYRPFQPYQYTPSHYPQEPLAIFDDPRLYSRLDTDFLFYAFYYRQGTYQQYLAAKALKSQSWRFHKQYQTWFQRHEEPKSITEDYEQGTYRFFDYESTWMNRRKMDFRFAYKFLEDDL
ncbi:hypothetical protein W97_02461 [Coniosporium apollinis CBS 100218]|uniref:General negative regulator of transcription subunit n=1 Tax=Coniosporium apollinis (strain CBS 100218) TaxID=1168221 RepID=R7YN49_CONA1|nr:uncharacterized protein W97_02461 [Coniosporium apollinis CBS 100218]EON63234.1 hypothetical protein W97_02461 [Coniosporium apollinis CBS 100218]